MPEGFSSDGYIIDQDYFTAYPYRTMTSDVNGCGWIAAYNLLRATGREADFNAVRSEMDGMFVLRVPGPTTMSVMQRYLAKYAPECRLTCGRAACLEAALKSRAGIFRYWEGREPHFASYVRREDGLFRFFNVADGQEDFSCPMDDFIRIHCTRGAVRVFTAA